MSHISYPHKHITHLQASAAIQQQHLSVCLQEPVHPPKGFSCSREMIAGAFSHPGADSSSPERTSHSASLGLLKAARRRDHFPRSTEGRICPSCRVQEEVEDTGLCTQSGSRQAAWVPATERHSEFRGQLRANAESIKHITLCKNQFLCWSQRGEQSYSNQDQFTLSGVPTGERGLQ